MPVIHTISLRSFALSEPQFGGPSIQSAGWPQPSRDVHPGDDHPIFYARLKLDSDRPDGAVDLARKKTTTFEERFPTRSSPTLSALAANVRRIRLERDLSQDKLASLVQVDQTAISLIENSRSNPTVTMLEAIAEALEVTVIELIDAAVSPRG
jgi:DNA-binding XRE family transcriptional regulator